MQKGQTSIDLMLALIVAIVFMSVLSIHANNLSVQADESAIRNTLKAVLVDVYAATGQVKAYGTTINYTAPKNPPGGCIITINKSGGTISASTTSGTMTESYTGLDLGTINVSPSATFSCSGTATISKA